jgi:nucleotide-binding universal stress UspA family protein
MFPVSSILWPTDGGEPSYKALEAAIAIAEKFNAEICALRVVAPVPPLAGPGYAPVAGSGYEPMAIKGYDVPLYQQELLKIAENDLSQIVSKKIPKKIVVACEVKIGNPADVIVEFAQENNIDMIVMATHGRTGVSRFMIGSVAEKTIRQSTIPLLIIPAASGKR